VANLQDLQKQIEEIKERNKRVEADKAWETSWTRRVLLLVFTYVVVVLFFYFAGLPHPWLNSLVPAFAFVLSTLSLPMFKKLWLKRKYER
jgi:polyferredoxin